MGDVEDFIIDTDSWKITSLVVKTGNWFSDKNMLLSIAWISMIDWHESQVALDVTIEQVQQCGEFDPDSPGNEVYEKVLRDYRGQKIY